MGLIERVKSWLRGEDPVHLENADQVGSTAFKSGFKWPWNKVPIYADGQLPSGWYWDKDGKLRMPIAPFGSHYNDYSDRVLVDIPWTNDSGNKQPLSLLLRYTEKQAIWGSKDGSTLNTYYDAYTWQSFQGSALADTTGTLAAQQILAAAGANYKWQIGYITVEAHPTIQGYVQISDGIGYVPANTCAWLGHKQDTANTALEISGTDLEASSRVTWAGIARKVY